MKRYWPLKSALLGVILFISWSCSTNSSDPGNDLTSPGSDLEAEATLPETPLVSSIEADPELVSPGEQISFTGIDLITGILTFTSPQNETITTEIVDGSGKILLTQDANPGLYTGMLETEAGAVAYSSFRVADQPEVWLRANRHYTREGEFTVLSVEFSGIPAESTAAIFLQLESSGAELPFVPDETGHLTPGISVALANLASRPLRLEGMYQGTIQVRVEYDELDPSPDASLAEAGLPDSTGWVSNTIQLSFCSEPGIITGEIGGEGFVNAIWSDGEIRSNSTFTTTGSFSLAAGPGTVLIQYFRIDQDPLPEPESQIVSLDCGESMELAEAGGVKIASLVTQGDGTLPQYSSARSPLSSLRSRPAAQAGEEETCRTGLIFPTVRDADGVNKNHSILAGIALKTALNNAASRAEIQSMSDILAYMEAMVRTVHQSGYGEEWDSMMEVLQTNVASDFVISLSAARIGQRYKVNTTALPLLPDDIQVSASGQGGGGALFDPTFSAYSELSEKFRQAAICGSAEPESAQIGLDEELTIKFKVTDLNGEGVNGASVSISSPECGRLDPDSGSIEGDQFETKFSYHTEKYCAEELEFEADWTGSQGSVKTIADETIVRITPQLPELTLLAGSAPGIGNTANLATAITLYDDYDVRDDPAQLAGFTQDAVCKFLDGGEELYNRYFSARSESHSNKRGESTVLISNKVVESGEFKHLPINLIEMDIQLDTWAIEFEDDNVIRGAWASGANHSDPNLTHTPGTLLVYDIHNPGNLPIQPRIRWALKSSFDDASAYSVLVFYKVIDCGDDPAIESLYSFVIDGDILLESDNEYPGQQNGEVPLPDFEGDRQQIIMWVTSLVTTASIRDDDSGTDLGGRARLKFKLDVYLAQPINYP